MLASLDWNMLIGSLIVASPGLFSAIFVYRVHGQVKTPSGKSLGEVAEYAHDTAIANNLLLAAANGETQPISKETLHDEGDTPPRVPIDPKEE